MTAEERLHKIAKRMGWEYNRLDEAFWRESRVREKSVVAYDFDTHRPASQLRELRRLVEAVQEVDGE